MDRSSSHPVDLFTPERPAKSRSSSLVATSLSSPEKTRQKAEFFIAPPTLTSDQKKIYVRLPEHIAAASEVEFDTADVECIIGEYREGTDLYLYARFRDGIAHRFLAQDLKADPEFHELVRQYEQRKDDGSLEEFDPSAVYVHPKSRVRHTLIINRKKGTARKVTSKKTISSRSEVYSIHSSTSDEQSEIDEDDDTTDEEAYKSWGRRKSKRKTLSRQNKTTRQTTLLSPKKTRSKTQSAPSGSEDELTLLPTNDDDIEEVHHVRRSSRSRKALRSSLADHDYVDKGSDGEEASDASSPPAKSKKPIKKKIIRGLASRPTYGHFRTVADLDYDAFSDEETAPLRAHRDVCEKCHQPPAHTQIEALLDKPKKGRRKAQYEGDDEDSENEEEKVGDLGGWVRCLKCPVSAHWRCLAKTQRNEIMRAAHARDKATWKEKQEAKGVKVDNVTQEGPPKRAELGAYQTTEFLCGSCMKGGICMGCLEVALEPDASTMPKENGGAQLSDGNTNDPTKPRIENADTTVIIGNNAATPNPQLPVEDDLTPKRELFYRCFTCKRLAHYGHLAVPEEYKTESGDPIDDVTLAEYYQFQTAWRCSDCASFTYSLDKILAWRPYPPTAVESAIDPENPPNYKTMLPREYLVKWIDRSYKWTQWVPHMWLVSTNASKLRNFLSGGTKVELLKEPISEGKTSHGNGYHVVEAIATQDAESVVPFEIGAGAAVDATEELTVSSPLQALPDAERRIPVAWKTVDRVLDVLFWCPLKHKKSKKNGNMKSVNGRIVIQIDDDEDSIEEEASEFQEERKRAFERGKEPSRNLTANPDEWIKQTGKLLHSEDIGHVVWAFIKWDDLGYEEATWDSPPRPGEPGYVAFETAFQRFVKSREVTVVKRQPKDNESFDNRRKNEYKEKHALKDGAQPDLGQSNQLKLMPFQVDGVNWLCHNWWNLQHCILADEMGLGKTVQVVTFLGTIIGSRNAFPALVVVPNSTITNWVREFERWAPRLRVVPFYGESKAREIIKQYELFHDKVLPQTTGAKYHVLVTTYDTLTNNKDFLPIFKKNPRWEVLVVDEGQRLKSDASLLFKKLNELNTIHRIIMTGTPLNNNIRELFNLMNFLDPDTWHDLEALEKEYAVLTEERVKDLHNKLRPYFLRRIKSEVLQLPPKNEVIVPVSMAPLQKELYRSILSQNLQLLKSLAQPSTSSRVSAAATKTNLNNILMQLRKCLQHPYLISEDIEPRGLSSQETHEKLIGASAKLRLLKTLLPKLKARGHRVLLFSQFVIALDIIEDFLSGEGFRYSRLDGNTRQSDRQKGMDEFNKPNSEIFIYLLTTRAGGVGINLWSADTVIIFDPDFNPHQDLQAIARAHRYGQTKTCLVFKLMVKDSAEERIIQTGKKKLVLDHLIVQKMDDGDGTSDDVQSILTYGAKTLFEEGGQSARDIIYTDHDVEKLIERTETEGDQVVEAAHAGLSFSFAKIWAAEKDTLEEIEDSAETNHVDSWAQTLLRIAEEKAKTQTREATGRGVRRRATGAPKPQQVLDVDLGDSPEKVKNKKKRRRSESSESGESDAYASPIVSDSAASVTSVTEENIPQSLPPIDDPNSDIRARIVLRSLSRSLSPTIYRPTDGNQVRYRPAQDSLQPSIPLAPVKKPKKKQLPVQSSSRDKADADVIPCGLCGLAHGSRHCYMTESSENLAEYREILLKHADDEPWEERKAAIQIIDKTLSKRGHVHLISGQPLFLVGKGNEATNPSRKKLSSAMYAAASTPSTSSQSLTHSEPSVPSKSSKPSKTTARKMTAPPGPKLSKTAALPESTLPSNLPAPPAPSKPSKTTLPRPPYGNLPSSEAFKSSEVSAAPQPATASNNTLSPYLKPTNGAIPSASSISNKEKRPRYELNADFDGKKKTKDKGKAAETSLLPISVSSIGQTSSTSALPSKRPSSPLLPNVSSKRAKQAAEKSCPICLQTPYHLVKDCIVVAEGPQRIEREIRRLNNDPSEEFTVHVLRSILQKHKKQERES